MSGGGIDRICATSWPVASWMSFAFCWSDAFVIPALRFVAMLFTCCSQSPTAVQTLFA